MVEITRTGRGRKITLSDGERDMLLRKGEFPVVDRGHYTMISLSPITVHQPSKECEEKIKFAVEEAAKEILKFKKIAKKYKTEADEMSTQLAHSVDAEESMKKIHDLEQAMKNIGTTSDELLKENAELKESIKDYDENSIATEDHVSDMEQLKEEHKGELEGLRLEHEDAIGELTREWEGKLEDQQSIANEREAELEGDINELREKVEDRDTTINELQKELDDSED